MSPIYQLKKENSLADVRAFWDGLGSSYTPTFILDPE